MNYNQQLEVIKGLFLPPDTEIRLDCPFCLNKNTLAITTSGNSYRWYCFHASCKAKGKHEGEKTMSYVNATFQKKDNQNIVTEFEIPDSFKSVYSNKKAMEYLNKNNCWEAWAWLRADIKYDVKQDRVVFLIKNRYTDKFVGAVGRALNKNVFPKWFMYGSKTVPFKSGQCNDAVIVEDCPSACAVSNVLTGIAIMGTSLGNIELNHLYPYKNLYICLDRDATVKAYSIASQLKLKNFKNVYVKPLTEDLKYYNTKQIEEIFYGKN